MTDSPSAPAGAADSVPATPALLEQELAAVREGHLRLAADFDNFKKRTRRDAERQAAAEKETFIRELLPTLDHLGLALACGHSSASGQLRQGVEMTMQQLVQLLRRHGIEAAEDLGRPFDLRRQEAVSLRHDPDQPDQSVLEVVQRGYSQGGQMFRPARVIVNDLGQSPGASRGR